MTQLSFDQLQRNGPTQGMVMQMKPSTPLFTLKAFDWDSLPRLAGMDHNNFDEWTYHNFVEAIESKYAIGIVAYTQNMIAGFIIYVVSDTTPKSVRKQNRLHLTVNILKL